MAEPIAALTDYAIALECLIFAGILLRWGRVGWLWAAAFGSVSIAALLGGTYHGFAEALPWSSLLIWQGTALSLAIASFFVVAATAAQVDRIWRLGLLFLATAKLILLLRLGTGLDDFAIRIIDYLSALGVVGLVQIWCSPCRSQKKISLRPSASGSIWMILGITISVLAIGILVLPWPSAWNISPLGGYHGIQIVALYCIYRGVCGSMMHL